MARRAPQANDEDRYNRRLTDKICAAFDHACDDGELITAAELLATLETVLLRDAPRPDRRETVVAPLIALHARLWALKAGRTDWQGMAQNRHQLRPRCRPCGQVCPI